MSRELALEELVSGIKKIEAQETTSPTLHLTEGSRQAVKRGLLLLKYRARSEVELRRRLIEAGHSSDSVDDAIAVLFSWSLIDDASFAEQWVQQRRRRRGKSVAALSAELRNKGVDNAVIAGAVSGISFEDEYQKAIEILRERCKKSAYKPSSDVVAWRRRSMGYLQRRGYSAGLAAKAVRTVLDGERA